LLNRRIFYFFLSIHRTIFLLNPLVEQVKEKKR